MAESISICRHNKNGTGYCERLGEYCVEGPCKAEELIEYAPLRHGRWITEDCDLLFAKRAECSVCGKGLTTTDIFDYCPNCGCKMDKEE